MHYSSEFKVWYSDYEQTEFRIEWLYFEKDTALHPLIQSTPHVGFIVQDIEKAIRGKKILLKPCLYENILMAFIEDQGVPIEFLQPIEAPS